MRQAGCNVFPVDHSSNRFTPRVPTFTIDLGNTDEVKVAEQLLRFTTPKAVNFGLMCGTCSRARDRSLAISLHRQGAPEPAPLRDEQHLLGKPNLKPHDKVKVEKANQIYSNAIVLLQICFGLKCIVLIENPARSWLWPLLATLVKETGRTAFIQWYFSLVSTMFDCMHVWLNKRQEYNNPWLPKACSNLWVSDVTNLIHIKRGQPPKQFTTDGFLTLQQTLA